MATDLLHGTQPRYLEDFTVGEATTTGKITLTRERILAFAREYDPQPMHVDDAAARNTLFGELVASGWQTLSYTVRLLVDAHLLGGTPIVGAEVTKMRLYRPVRPGESITARAQVTAIHRMPGFADRGVLDLRVVTSNGEGAKLIVQDWRVVVPTRAAASPEAPE